MTVVAEFIPHRCEPARIPDSALSDFDVFRNPTHLAVPSRRIREMLKAAPLVSQTPCNADDWMFISDSAGFRASHDTGIPNAPMQTLVGDT
jgi:hypothetical protein